MLTFKNGIHPDEKKEISKNKPITEVKPKEKLVFPMQQHIGAKATPLVKVGDTVLKGQIIGEANGFISANVLSSVSGKVVSIENKYVIGGNYVESIVVENDFKYDTIENFGKKNDYTNLSNDEIIKIVKDAGICGLGGAGFPTHVKLSPKEPEKIDYVLVNAAECEPYLTSDYRLLKENPEGIIEGLKVILKLFENAKGLICIEDNKRDIYDNIKNLVKDIDRIDAVLLKTKYPQGGERQLIYAVTGRKIDSTILPADKGVIVDNVDTVYSIGNAVCNGIPLLRRIMTISGDAFKDTYNLSVPFGINYNDIVEFVGGFISEPEVLLSGGPMMGISIYDLDVPVTKSSSALLAFKKNKLKKSVETNCINCGRCINACPIFLAPNMLYKASKQNNMEKFIELNGAECINCGCCSFVCPAKKPLAQYFNMMKTNVRAYLLSKKEAK